MDDTRQWFHVVISTYGSWLYGDPRGFRTRHHREHVDGDYKNPPPPGRYDERERQSRESLKQPPVVIAKGLRSVLGVAIKERLESLGALLICIAVSGQHVHFVAKMPRTLPREWTGIAKRHGWFVLREQGWKGKLWGKRSKPTPIRERAHQLNTYRYVLKHELEGAWVWGIGREH